jgi:sulfite exporter TauE/SafE
VECLAQCSSVGIESVFHRITLHLSLFSILRNILFVSLCSIMLLGRTKWNFHSKTNFVRRLNVLHGVALLELRIYFIGLFSSYDHFQFEETLNLAHHASSCTSAEKHVTPILNPTYLEGWMPCTMLHSGSWVSIP